MGFFTPSLHLPVHTCMRWWQMDWKGDNFYAHSGVLRLTAIQNSIQVGQGGRCITVEPVEIKTGQLYELTSLSLPCHRHVSSRHVV